MVLSTTCTYFLRRNQTSKMLHDLNVPVHRIGYRLLCIAIPYYAEHNTLYITKELYPFVARRLGHSDWHSAERGMRNAITDAWEHRDPEIWDEYFPYLEKAPSNKMFIAVLAEYLN